jgi:hypothetical protein
VAFHIDTGIPRAGWVIADGVSAATKVGAVQDKGEDCGKHNKQRKLEGQRAEDIALAEPGEALRIRIERLIAEQDVSDAAVQTHGADGDNDGGEVKTRHQEAIEQAAQQPHAQPHADQQCGIHTCGGAKAHYR